MTNPRWGKLLSRQEAEALANKWSEGSVISEPERFKRLQDWIMEHVGEEIDKRSFSTLNEVRGYMKEKGLTEFESDIDQNLLNHSICEEICAKDIGSRRLKGPDLDAAFWTCMHQCSDVQDPTTMDMDDPLFPHTRTRPDEFMTMFSFPEQMNDSRDISSDLRSRAIAIGTIRGGKND